MEIFVTLLFAAFVVLMVLHAVGSRRRFYIGSAAIFWFFVAVVIWGTLFYVVSLPLEKDNALSVASHFSAPAIIAALLAVLIRNLSYSGVLSWLITPPVFVFGSYIMLHGVIGNYGVGGH
jgi:Sec-independent protein secretion pathway component TatC